MTTSNKIGRLAEDQWKAMDKMPASLFNALYGSIVVDCWKQSGYDAAKANSRLDRLGHSIGTRLIEELCAKTHQSFTGTFPEVSEALLRLFFKMYLNASITLEYGRGDTGAEQVRIQSEEGFGGLLGAVVLPDAARGSHFNYVQPLCGMLRAMFEAVWWRVDACVSSDQLKGDQSTEIVIGVLERMDEERPPKDD